MTTCCTINENGLNLQQKLGLSLGSTTGPFSWPYAACTGKVAKNGIFRPLNIKEAYNVCISFCKKQKDITGKDPISEEFEDLVLELFGISLFRIVKNSVYTNF